MTDPVAADHRVKTRKKLIEVALPLEEINIASAREKSIRHGHPSTLHLWWARRPLAAARAVIFSQMVDDPGEYVDELLADPGTRGRAERELATRITLWQERTANRREAARAEGKPTPEVEAQPTLGDVAADVERQRLFEVIKLLVQWENTTNEPLLEQARAEIRRSWRRTCADNADHPRAAELFDTERLPAFHDPFAGGGALPLEAQRLGLEAYASDLNPVAVLINKAMIEIPPRFAGRPPVNPDARLAAGHSGTWAGAEGLAEDVRYYGQWMRDEAERRIGHFYPNIEVTAEMSEERPDLRPHVGRNLTVIAWLWARTVKSPNPAFAMVDVPLVSTFMLSTKPGKEAWVDPVIEDGGYRFTAKVGKAPARAAAGTKAGRGATFLCLMSGIPIGPSYIRSEAQSGRMGARLMAIVAALDDRKVYLAPTAAQEAAARGIPPSWRPDLPVSTPSHDVDRLPMYGMPEWADAFTERQLVAVSTFSDLVGQAREQIAGDIDKWAPDEFDVESGRSGAARAYADAVAVYLSFAVDRCADYWTSMGRWQNVNQQLSDMFSRQAIPMMWDYPEANPFSGRGGSFNNLFAWTIQSLSSLGRWSIGHAEQTDASEQSLSDAKVISTDPPYFDNVGYSDLSDFFYVWLRRNLGYAYPDLFATVATPKSHELVAASHRHGGRLGAEEFFLSGMTQAMSRIAEQAHPAFPATIYYAFKQTETSGSGATTSTGWEVFLEALFRAGLSLAGTWPIRTELSNRMIGAGANALASSIVLVCRGRDEGRPTATRREFLSTLRAELPQALAQLQRGNVAPVDLAQASIGPGMAVFTRYARVLDAGGRPLSVGQALALINQTLDEVLAEQEGDFDPDTRWALAWFEQSGFEIGDYGVADVLARAKNTSVDGMVQAGVVDAGRGKVRLLKPSELPADWDPNTDSRRPTWESVHHLIRALEQGEGAAAELIAKLGPDAEIARELAYRLYVLADRKGWAKEAGWYNALVQSFPEAVRLARATAASSVQQPLFDTE